MKTLSLIVISATTTFAQFGNSRSGAGMTNQQQELLRRRRRTTTPPTEYPTDPPFFNEDELLLNGGYDGIYDDIPANTQNSIEGSIAGSLRSMSDENLETLDRAVNLELQTDQELEVHEGLADYLKALILNPQTAIDKRKQYENLYDAVRRRMEMNNTHVGKAAMQWYLGKHGRSHCERTIQGTVVRGDMSVRSGPSSRSSCETLLPLNLNYGCWCHANDEDVFKGSGDYVDEFDKACKMMKQCLRCVRYDAREANEVCDPSNQPYLLTQDFTNNGVLQECETANNGNCATNTCCCEIEFTRSILDIFMNQEILLTEEYHHEHGFDYENNCSGLGPTGFTKSCCGEYPGRRMYATEKMTCCQERSLFNPNRMVCCDDGSVAPTAGQCGAKKKRKKRNA